MADEFAWPKKGNKAFISRADGATFQLRRMPYDLPEMAEAFKNAADLVVDNYKENDWRVKHHDLFFPAAYLYRHAIELRMKDIIRIGLGMEFFKKDDVAEDLERHNLARLWNHAKKLLKDRWPTSDDEPLRATEAVINECHQADPNGQVFRYDADKDGKRHRHDKLPDNISLADLRKTMDGVFNFLDATANELESNLSDMLQAQRDAYERERRD